MATAVEERNEQPPATKPANWFAGVQHFWHEVWLEMKKVSWPTRPEVINTTIIVIIAVFFFAAFLFLTDLSLTYFIRGIEWLAKKALT